MARPSTVQICTTKSKSASPSGAGLRRRDLALVAQRQRHLPQLVVEQMLGLGEHVAVGGDAEHQRGERDRRQQRGEQAGADRGHASGTAPPPRPPPSPRPGSPR